MSNFRYARMGLLAILGFLGLLVAPATAHKPSDSYLRITAGGERLTAQWDLALKDLEFLVGLDTNFNGEITWGELKAQREAIAAQTLSRLQINAEGRPVRLHVAQLLVTDHSDGAYAVLVLQGDCSGAVSVLDLHYDLLFDVDPTHRGLVLYTNDGLTSTHVLRPAENTLQLRAGEVSLWSTFLDYLREGVWHIWIGYDHILFLLSLLLPAVLLRTPHRWQGVEAFGPACLQVLKIVTVFTLAHSITLWLAVMEYVTLPGRMVEVVIAFSIVLTALNNLFPVFPQKGWAMAFGFGLVHGFGFANVLLDLGLSDLTLAISLLGFNLGVELGQMAIVIAFLPVGFLLRNTAFYRWVVLRLGSVVIAVIAGLWMYERVFQVEILGF